VAFTVSWAGITPAEASDVRHAEGVHSCANTSLSYSFVQLATTLSWGSYDDRIEESISNHNDPRRQDGSTFLNVQRVNDNDLTHRF